MKYLLSILLILTSFFSWAESKPVTINIGFDLWPGYYPLVIAKQQGLFAQQGLQVNYFIPENTDFMLKKFSNKELDAICVSVGDIFNLLPTMPDIRVPLVADISAGGDALLSLKPMPRFLDGLKIGTNLNGFGELFVHQFLADHNTDFQAVSLIDIDASKARELLANKTVDIAHTWQPYVSENVDAGARIIYTSRQTPGLIPDVVVFSGDFIKQHPDALRGFIRAWLEALDWWEQNPAAGNQLIQTELNLSHPVSSKGIKLMNLADNIDAFSNQRSPRALPKVISRYVDFFYQKGILTQRLQANQIIDSRFLTEPPPN
ncbi:MAG: NitT/TauT family transport system substrate-binding protein [Oceanicoccus sp.]|jgi:NitT/TauT family transport system substrate-binding protein